MLARYLEERSIPEPNTGCRLWLGACTKAGYANSGRGYGHHLAYEVKTGSAPGPGVVVRHKCDVRCCVNPDHVLGGTTADNAQDMVDRGRQWPGRRAWAVRNNPKGEDHRMAKLTAAEVRSIRAALSLGELQKHVAVRFGVSKSTINLIALGRIWKNV